MDQPAAQFLKLKEDWTRAEQDLRHRLWADHGQALETVKHVPQHLLVSALAGLLIFTHHTAQSAFAQISKPPESTLEIHHTQEDLVAQLSSLLPQTVQPLTPQQDAKVGKVLSDYFDIPVWAVLAGNQLNRTYGYIGAEQHLMRYPGDTIASHFQTADEMAATGKSGMAPGRGAWGYFAPSYAEMSQRDIDREKYYLAVQTFLSPGWGERTNELYAFFKFRKMLIVNPDNGNAMVVVIGDAGPSAATGKHLGGSPEVMKYLERVDGAQKGPVLYYFIDDPEDKIPLGPIHTK